MLHLEITSLTSYFSKPHTFLKIVNSGLVKSTIYKNILYHNLGILPNQIFYLVYKSNHQIKYIFIYKDICKQINLQSLNFVFCNWRCMLKSSASFSYSYTDHHNIQSCMQNTCNFRCMLQTEFCLFYNTVCVNT